MTRKKKKRVMKTDHTTHAEKKSAVSGRTLELLQQHPLLLHTKVQAMTDDTSMQLPPAAHTQNASKEKKKKMSA